MTADMKLGAWGVTSVILAGALVLGCPSKGGEQKDAQSGATATGGATSGGPLAGLESSTALPEGWTSEDGQKLDLVYYARENVRISAKCKQPNGQLACDAIRFMRNGTPVEIPRRSLDGRQSAGVKVCMKLGYAVVVVRNSVGAEDSVCRFPDGSLVSNGALEQYSLRVIQ